ncbi:hypothetical protein [Enterococcus faecalis]|uniref:hypothetical protein n=1 Tax=Enterococcus faecalis TaxID=1351 RepID=UPI001E4EE2B6|nr:hypothetical protein [Enterococcus faecalis]
MVIEHSLYKELKGYGFIFLEGEIPEKQARRFLYVKKMLNRKNLKFQPMREVCFERMVSRHTSLYIEGFDRYSSTGNYIGYRYDFYKATYLFDSTPARLKVYGTDLTRRELLYIVKGFFFLKVKQQKE